MGLLFTACSEKEPENKGNALQMQEFVVNLSGYARGFNPSFLIVVQNGEELVFNNADTTGFATNLYSPYLDAVDAFSAEEVHFNGTRNIDDYRRKILLFLGGTYQSLQKTVLVSDYLLDEHDWFDAAYLSSEFGFLIFIRMADNYYYSMIPDIGTGNTVDVNNIQGVSNYLCLLSDENFSDADQMLDSIAASNYDLVVIDLFFRDKMLTHQDLEKIRLKQNGSRRVVLAYISIGSAENYRYYWQSEWNTVPPEWIVKPYENYPDEYWVDYRDADWQKMIFGNDDSYLKKIIDAGFDGAFLDNVEAFSRIDQEE